MILLNFQERNGIGIRVFYIYVCVCVSVCVAALVKRILSRSQIGDYIFTYTTSFYTTHSLPNIKRLTFNKTTVTFAVAVALVGCCKILITLLILFLFSI